MNENHGQRQINRVWSKNWELQKDADVESVLNNRSTIEAYPVFNGYIPSSARSILETGTGTGRFGVMFARDMPASEVTITDVLPESLDLAKKLATAMNVTNVLFKIEDVNSLSFGSGTFDVVFSDAVVQHLPDELRAWKEMARVLKPGGRLIVSVINKWNFHNVYKVLIRLGRKAYPYGYEKSYTHRDLARLARQAGLEPVSRDGYYVGYGLYRHRKKWWGFGVLGRLVNRLSKIGDRYSGRFFSRIFGFEIVIVARKSLLCE